MTTTGSLPPCAAVGSFTVEALIGGAEWVRSTVRCTVKWVAR